MACWADSPYTGIFTRFGRIPPRPHDPEVAVWSGMLAPWGARSEELPVGGAGWDDEAAHDAALGEGVERLQPYPLPGDRCVETTFDDWPLSEPAVEPERWALFHREQHALSGFPFRPFTRGTRCRWVCFRQVFTGDPWWVPEELGYLFLPPGRAHRLCPSVSTGLSCGRVGQPVLLRGLQEVIERDAVVGAWWERYALVEKSPADVLGSLDSGLSPRLLRPNLGYRFYQVVSPFSTHVTLVTVEGEERHGFCLGIGSACRETRSGSWLKSILEAVHGYRYVRHLTEDPREAPLDDLPATFHDHAIYYALHAERLETTVLRRRKRVSAHGAAVAGGEEAPETPGREDIAVLAARLGEERPILFRDMTPPAIASAIGEWRVLKVLVPGLQPLHGNHRLAHLGGPLWAPRGLEAYAQTPPHPFA